MAGSVRAPHPVLAPYVGPYVGYHHVLDPRAVHHGLPAPTATVVIAFDQPLDVGWLDEPASQSTYWMLASGLHTGAALIRTHGYQHGIQLELTPLGVRALLGLPAGALGATMTSHDNLPLGLTAAAYDAIASATSWDERFEVLEAHLLAAVAGQRHDPAHVVRPELAEAWRLLAQSRGRMAVEEVAARVGWSRRHLAARFSNEYGVGPKQAGRLIRFSHARALVRAGRSLGDTAYAAGFADQAHLTRDWRALAGQTPTETIAEVFPIVQDAADPALAPSGT
jgi:AraC-like DNA-binding protein